MKAAMKAREKETLATIRLIQAEFKRVEVDERIEIDDARALARYRAEGMDRQALARLMPPVPRF